MMTSIKVIQWDITEQDTDAIVNSANPRLSPWWWISGSIHQKAWIQLTSELNQIIKKTKKWFLETGDAIISHWWDLMAQYIIHTVWPKYTVHWSNWAELLERCYNSCLDIALKNWIKSISFPSISTGIYWCPIEYCSKIAVNTVKDFTNKHIEIEEVRFILFSEKDYETYKTLV